MGYKRDLPMVLTPLTLKFPEFHGAGFCYLSLLRLTENALLLIRAAAEKGDGRLPSVSRGLAVLTPALQNTFFPTLLCCRDGLRGNGALEQYRQRMAEDIGYPLLAVMPKFYPQDLYDRRD